MWKPVPKRSQNWVRSYSTEVKRKARGGLFQDLRICFFVSSLMVVMTLIYLTTCCNKASVLIVWCSEHALHLFQAQKLLSLQQLYLMLHRAYSPTTTAQKDGLKTAVSCYRLQNQSIAEFLQAIGWFGRTPNQNPLSGKCKFIVGAAFWDPCANSRIQRPSNISGTSASLFLPYPVVSLTNT